VRKPIRGKGIIGSPRPRACGEFHAYQWTAASADVTIFHSAYRAEDYAMSTTEGGRVEGTRVLIVDSERAILDFVAAVLVDLGCTVKCAGSAREAKALANAEKFDLALVEVMLPDGRGEELAGLLRRAGTRTTLMSGHPDGIRLGRAAPDKFLAKPFGVSELLRAFIYQRVGEPSEGIS
jgi:CheY-like chemotaxis protein